MDPYLELAKKTAGLVAVFGSLAPATDRRAYRDIQVAGERGVHAVIVFAARIERVLHFQAAVDPRTGRAAVERDDRSGERLLIDAIAGDVVVLRLRVEVREDFRGYGAVKLPRLADARRIGRQELRPVRARENDPVLGWDAVPVSAAGEAAGGEMEHESVLGRAGRGGLRRGLANRLARWHGEFFHRALQHRD